MSGEDELRHLLERAAGPEPTAEVLAAIVARHRQRRARAHRLVATAALLVILAGAAVDLGLSHRPAERTAAPALRLRKAAGPPLGFTRAALPQAQQAPAGLTWDVDLNLGSHFVASSGAVSLSSANGASGALVPVPAPSEFGFASSRPHAQSSLSRAASYPVASVTDVAGGYVADHLDGCASICEVVYAGQPSVVLFRRQLRRAELTVSLESYSFPASPRAASALASGAPAPLLVHSLCPTSRELMVAVAAGTKAVSLYVPSGGPSERPFAVVASAAARLPGGETLALAVARTSPSVASVAARFGDGLSYAMAPKDHWVVLAAILPAPAPLARAGSLTLTARSDAAVTLERARVPSAGSLAAAPVTATCAYLVRPLQATGQSPPAAASSKP